MRIFFLMLLPFYLLSKTLTLQSDDGFILKGWLYEGNKSKVALLIHQYGSNHTMWSEWIQFFQKKGYSVFAPDLRAHGASCYKNGKKIVITPKDYGHTPKEAHLEKTPNDLKKWLMLLEKKGYSFDNAIFMGSSLGGAALIELLFDYEPKVLITISPSKVFHKKEAFDAIESFENPWLIITSQKDFVKELNLNYAGKAHSATLLLLPGKGHGKALFERAKPFIKVFLQNKGI